MEQTQHVPDMHPPEGESNPLALKTLDDHPLIEEAYQRKGRCEAAFAAAKAALEETRAKQRAEEEHRIVALMSGEPANGPFSDVDAPVSTADHHVRVTYQAVERATEEWGQIRERIRLELTEKCKALYVARLATAVAEAEQACESMTLLSRLYSRMSALCGPLPFPDCHYQQLQEDAPLPAGQWQGWYRVVQKSGLLPKK